MERLKNEAQAIQEFLEVTVSDDPNEMTARLADLSVYMARSGKMLADAKEMLRRKKSSDIINMVAELAQKSDLTPKAINALVDNIAVEENHLADWLDRINRACTHQSETSGR